MDIGLEILDQQLVDRTGLDIGKVDGIVLELRDGAPPRISALLTGGHLFAWRLHPRIERWARWLTRGWGPPNQEPLRIPWSKVKKIGVDVKVDIEADAAMPWEHWVRDQIISRIPGAG
jgi:sporulation protein YlmC with PRC-barrel domain